MASYQAPRGAPGRGEGPAPRRILPARLGTAVGLTGLGVIAYLGWLLLYSHAFPIRQVGIEGEFRHADRQTLRRIVTRELRDAGFFRLDLDGLRQALTGSAWVREVTVRRIWPDEILIQIQEEEPAARWGKRGFFNLQGRYFALSLEEKLADKTLPLLTGPEGKQEQVFRGLRELDALLAPRGLRVRALHMNRRQSWHMTLDNGWRVMLGRRQALAKAARFAEVAYPLLEEHKAARVRAVDMRYSNGYAVSWAGGARAPAAGAMARTTER